MTTAKARAAVLASTLALGLAACGDLRSPVRERASIVAAGDIAGCFWRGDEATARLLDRIDGVVIAIGDIVYQSGTRGEYARCYAPTWGRHKERTRPVPGNHDYRTGDAAPYFAYFGANAGRAGQGWYSYRVDGWHVVALNSEEPLKEGSVQLAWLREELRKNPTRCTLAYMHHPRFSSGKHGSRDRTLDAWKTMYAAGVDVVLSGHDHHYERFAPQTPDGKADPERGIRQFVLGMGGAPMYPVRRPIANSEAITNRAHGVLKLQFRPDGYDWEFVPIRGHRFRDQGSGTCSPPVALPPLPADSVPTPASDSAAALPLDTAGP